MRRYIWIAFPCALMAAVAVSGAMAQTLQPGGATKQQPDQHPGVPAAAPRTPVKKEGGTRKEDTAKKAAPAKKTPVVPPHGPAHPEKAPAIQPKTQPGPVVPPGPVTPAPPVPETRPAPAPEKPASNEKEAEQDKETVKLPLPRFASLRSDDVNMRSGPGTRYRIDWVYKRRELPVEIEREFDVWRWVRDADGIQGWVNAATLMGRRTFIVQKTEAVLRAEGSDSAAPVAVLKPGVIGRIRSCESASAWCVVQTGSFRGYLRRDAFWGTFPGERIAP